MDVGYADRSPTRCGRLPLAVVIGVLGGVAAFGPIGVIAGPVVLALVIALIRFGVDVRETPIDERD